MKKLFIILTLVVTSMMLLMSGAEAKRLGGGGSFGKQSSNYSRQVPSSPSGVAPAKPAAPAAAPLPAGARPASPWKGILGGALLGLGLGALMSHFGLGGGMFGSILLIALLAFVAMYLFRLLSRKSQEQPAYSAYGDEGGHPQPVYANLSQPSLMTPQIGSGLQPAALNHIDADSHIATVVPWGIPADFDVAGFVRNGKSYFIRLQAAWDKADINDIREFTTPEMFGELRLQLQERGVTPNNTDVVKIEGELLGIETQTNDYLATIRFTGLIKEAPDASAEPLPEIWNLSKPISGPGGWILAGIQQV